MKNEYDVSAYQTEMVRALKKKGSSILETLTPDQASAIHMSMALCGEAGELVDAVKKWAIYGKPLDRENAVEELGDLEFYMEGVRQDLGISREETLVANQKKLNTRYSSGRYSDEQAQARKDKQ